MSDMEEAAGAHSLPGWTEWLLSLPSEGLKLGLGVFLG